MFFITLQRPDVYSEKCIVKGVWEKVKCTQNPISINPQYIVSMVEMYDNDGNFEYTEISLSDNSWYHVTSKIEDITSLIDYKHNREINSLHIDCAVKSTM